MRFALLCYSDGSIREDKQLEDAVLAKHHATNARLREAGQLGPNLRLVPPAAAMTVRAGPEPMMLDGPFAETKEVLLGLWVFDAASLDEAIGIAGEFASHMPDGSLELRPVMEYDPGVGLG